MPILIGNVVKPMGGSAPDLDFCTMFGQCRRSNYLCSPVLVEWFADDLDASLSGELVQFAALLDTDIGRQATSIASQPDDAIDVITTGEAVELRMYRLIWENTMQSCFPTVEILLCMYLCLMVTNCTGEHSFSKLRRIKNAQRTMIGQGRLNMQTLMSIKSELLGPTQD